MFLMREGIWFQIVGPQTVRRRASWIGSVSSRRSL